MRENTARACRQERANYQNCNILRCVPSVFSGGTVLLSGSSAPRKIEQHKIKKKKNKIKKKKKKKKKNKNNTKKKNIQKKKNNLKDQQQNKLT
ncbi:hypothetical protein, partial [Escherichia coli]|uniref:hypothetical protein n=1 Tax=Escherichia coli TaxID=562 RepID=UPI002FF225EC